MFSLFLSVCVSASVLDDRAKTYGVESVDEGTQMAGDRISTTRADEMASAQEIRMTGAKATLTPGKSYRTVSCQGLKKVDDVSTDELYDPATKSRRCSALRKGSQCENYKQGKIWNGYLDGDYQCVTHPMDRRNGCETARREQQKCRCGIYEQTPVSDEDAPKVLQLCVD